MDDNRSAHHSGDGNHRNVEEMDTDRNNHEPDSKSSADGGEKDNADVEMDHGEGFGSEIDPESEGSEADSDNENNEDIVEEEEDDSRTKVKGQPLKDSVFDSFSFTGDGTTSKEKAECVKQASDASEQWVSRDVCNTAVLNTQKKFVCVKFPAVIKNKEKALACLGGVENLAEAKKNGKIDLVFRPDDPYSKPIIGLYKKNCHVLLKCKRRRRPVNQPSTSMADNVDDGYEYRVEVLGVVEGIFSFERPCDFQYLPVTKNNKAGGGYQEILSQLLLKFEDDRESFINRDVPLFLPPYVFSRAERAARYIFQDDENTGEKHIGSARKMRHTGTQRVTFSSGEVPQAPNHYAVTYHKQSNSNLQPLKELFQERPLWSRVAIMSRLRALDKIYLNRHTNMVAYSFSTGPWIHLWCRFAYDPRQHPEAKIYQTIDFRIRKIYCREKVKAKRPNLCHQIGKRGHNSIRGHQLPSMGEMANQSQDDGGQGVASTSQVVDIHYQFSPTIVPPYRQMFYQACDVMHQEVQRIVHLNDGKESECSERDGWCVPDFLVMTRDIMANHAEKLLWTGVEGALGDEEDVG